MYGTGAWPPGMQMLGKAVPPTAELFSTCTLAGEDYFYNGKGSVYGADYEGGGGSLWSDFYDPESNPNPATGIFVGTARRTTGSESFTYNCFTESSETQFEYEDEEFKTCRSYVTCVQKDALKIFAKGSEEVVRGEGEELPAPADIYSKFPERYDDVTGVCDPAPIEISDRCSVKFECKNHDKPEVMNALVDNLNLFGTSEAYNQWEEEYTPPCNPSAGGCPPPRMVTFRTMPDVTQLIARGVPPPDSGRFGYEVAYIQTSITCEQSEADAALCDAFGTIFGLAGMIEPLAELAEFGGMITEFGCGLAGVE